MAPPKVKKPPKAIEKPVEKLIIKSSTSKKIKKRNYQSFSIYIYRLLRSVATQQENLGISRQTMIIMNNFVNDMLETIASEAARLPSHGKSNTLTSRDIQSAVKLLIPGELAKHADIEATKAIAMYRRSHAQN